MNTRAQRRLKNMPYHSERLFALMREEGGRTVMCYRLAPTPASAYAAVINEETLGTGHTMESLREAGWVARPVYVEEKGSR